MSRPIISVENLSKAYRLGLKEEVPDTMADALKGVLRSPLKKLQRLRRLSTTKVEDHDDQEDTLWALKDVSFEVNEGDVLGIIGRNGAGKSTLLKILSRITEPTSGRAVIRGRVSSLLEVGTGFHPELSGRDNIYMNGTILGMTKREIDRKFDEIVDFSGVEKFLDTPTKRYSSGMQVRLAFAVAAHLEPEILIIDEVLAVGDAEFQRRCMGKMQSVAESGRTVIFVSHNLDAVETLCDRAVEVRRGQVASVGVTGDVMLKYRNSIIKNNEPEQLKRLASAAYLRSAHIIDKDHAVIHSIAVESDLMVLLRFKKQLPAQSFRIGIGIDSIRGQRMLTCFSTDSFGLGNDISSSDDVLSVVQRLPLTPGDYTLTVGISSKGKQLDLISEIAPFTIVDGVSLSTSKRTHPGVCIAKSEWRRCNNRCEP
ncbi:Teichoic acids export ATP-binding protein TagH [Rosistilla oblonga]|uniref:ABC transporter ATP-binding protein n=1 Tax=Rosistilla oblonga TaxID=2527990 RepID=UPI0011879C05|nr:ABC transporter ATP-binding protein [Rosistilla oblonga]QDV14261.1 Teichoic acids export ATP-binding protein TagH [Rosistilla oblonga]